MGDVSVSRGLAVLLVGALACSRATQSASQDPVPTAASTASIASRRPVPYNLIESPAFARAVERGTRTRTGAAGPRYWQQWARYTMAADYDPATGRLSGTSSVRYLNRSPDSLTVLFVHVYPNLFGPGAYRNRRVPEVGPVAFTRVAAAGQDLAALPAPFTPGAPPAPPRTPGYRIDGTIMRLTLPQPLRAGDSTDLAFAWSYTVAPEGGPRGGRTDLYAFVSYWYPQLAVYDDINGWQIDQYRANAEFYMGYADYEVALTVPAGFLIAATGTLLNPHEVLTAPIRDRLALARTTDSVVHVVAAADRGAGRSTAAGPKLTWRFRARGVRDFDWGLSDRYVWDATHAVVGDANGDGVPDTTAISAFWVPEKPGTPWARGAGYTRDAIEFLSRLLWPYPWPQMTAADGPSCGGMEYPMITCISAGRDTIGLASVIVHETGHMWFPMQVGSDEKRHSWQDEGLTQFNAALGMAELYPGSNEEQQSLETYLFWTRTGNEVELMRHGDLYPLGSPAFGIASYAKMATVLRTLRGLIGDSTFLRAYREYGRRWRDKHPQPEDLWYAFQDVARQDLWWFWRTWFYETWSLDQAVASVTPRGAQTEIVIEDRGLAPMPVLLAITRTGGAVERRTMAVEVWLTGLRRTTVTVPTGPGIASVQIDPDGLFPDTDRANNRWPPLVTPGRP
jgi:hypothetical protein